MRGRAVAGVLAAVAVAGCGGNHVDQLSGEKSKGSSGDRAAAVKSPSPSPSPSSTDSPAVRKAKTDALAAYRKYWFARVEAMATADTETKKYQQYSIDRAVGTLYATLLSMKRSGRISDGEPVLHPTVLSVEFNKPPADPNVVRISDCLDVSHVTLRDSRTKKPVKQDLKYNRYVASSTVRTVGNDWRVADIDFKLDQPC